MFPDDCDRSIKEDFEWHPMGRELVESNVGSNITRAGLLRSKHDTFKIYGI